MPTDQEDLQLKEFLKRADIKTMEKDLRKLREVDALEEKKKIINIKTPEEQKAELQKKQQAENQAKEKQGREEVLQKNANEEKVAESQVKNYANEQEKQQIFLLESKKLDAENRLKEVVEVKEPANSLEKNKVLLKKQEWQKKLESVLENEKNLEAEQKLIEEKEKESKIPAEKKGLEKRRWEIEALRQKWEKNRWEDEKEIKNEGDEEKKISESSEILTAEENKIRAEILDLEKSLRSIYLIITNREEERRQGMAKEQKIAAEKREQELTKEKENIQREQWVHPQKQDNKMFLKDIPQSMKEKIAQQGQNEEEQRQKFLQQVDEMAEADNKNINQNKPNG